MVDEIDSIFEDKLAEAYFAEGSKLAMIDPNLPDFFEDCRMNGIKVGLNTGYSVKIQAAILEKLQLDKIVDGYTCAALAGGGRPTPFMVYDLMQKLDIADCRAVAKAGDTINDIKEGSNAGCGLVVGVTSGSDSIADLTDAGAHAVIANVTKIGMPPSAEDLQAQLWEEQERTQMLETILEMTIHESSIEGSLARAREHTSALGENVAAAEGATPVPQPQWGVAHGPTKTDYWKCKATKLKAQKQILGDYWAQKAAQFK